MPDKSARPFPLQLEVSFIDRLNEPVRDKKAKSVSAIIRAALERFDFDDAIVLHPAHVQISVRLPVEVKKNLKRVARSKHASIGHLVRAAVEAYLPELEAMPHPDEVKPTKAKKKAAKKRKPSKSTAKKSAKPKRR
jgi:predicted DNA-binding protein